MPPSIEEREGNWRLDGALAGSLNTDPFWSRPGDRAGRGGLVQMPARGYIHVDEAPAGKHDEARQAALRLDAGWKRWGGTIEAQVKAQLLRLDVAETIFFMRELAEIKPQMFDVIYATLKGRQFVPIISGDSGAETFIFTQFDKSGKAKRISGAAGDNPRVNVKGVQFINPYNSYGASFDYNVQELRAAAKAGRSIDALRAKQCRAAIAELQDDILALGDPDADNGSGSSSPMEGLLSYCLTGMGTQSFVVPQIAGSSVWIGNKTTDQIILDVNTFLSLIPQNTKDSFKPNTLLLPVAEYLYLASTPRSTISDTTILTFLEDAWPDVEFMSWNRLSGAGANAVSPGNGAHDMMVAYDRSPERLWCPITIEYEQLAPQLEKYTYAVYAEMRMGGVVSPYPLSMAFAAGIG